MRRLGRNVTLLGNRHFNFFLVGRKEAAIFECGVTAGVEILKHQWANLNPKPKVRYLVAMHAHFDHVCGIPQLRRMFPSAQVLASARAKEVMANDKIVGRFFREDQRMSESLVGEKLLLKAPSPQQADKLAVDRVIEGGESFTLDDHTAVEVISAPGHSPCGLACYLPEEQVMFVSDACGFQISDYDIFPIFFQGYDRYIQTIETLKAYPTRVLAIAHEKIWENEDVDGFYCRALQAAEEVLGNIRKMIDDGKEEEFIGEILFQRYYHGNLRIYTPENIAACVKLLIRRVKEKFRF